MGGVAEKDRAATAAVCDNPQQATVLKANPWSTTAQALWLDGHQLIWPGMADTTSGHRFSLLVSRAGLLQAPVGQAAVGVEERLSLNTRTEALPPHLTRRFGFAGAGVVLQLPPMNPAALRELHTRQMVLVQENAQGKVVASTRVQLPGALDALFAPTAARKVLGPRMQGPRTQLSLWAPTAEQVQLCTYPGPDALASSLQTLQRDAASGVWSGTLPASATGAYYQYAVTVHVPGVGRVRNRVTDPYAVSLNANSKRSQLLDLNDPALQPAGWANDAPPATVSQPTDMAVYELHVRDFSISDDSVPPAHQGKYMAFTHGQSRGMQHLKALARAGMTDVHLLPVFDLASVPETGCVTPHITPHLSGHAASDSQQAAVKAVAAQDCFNWGYDPLHFNAPEGSYATTAHDGRRRVVEFRQMVLALHRAGLRVGMDMVYNHTSASGQHAQSVLDRIVPGYYQRLNAQGVVERSTCCDNTATEHIMMDKLMSDSVLLWARHYKIDSFRFDLMGHQPRSAMVRMQKRLHSALGRRIDFIGEGWNFGEVAHGVRFVQASQLSLNGTGIGTFNDRLRDAVRGGSASDTPERIQADQGYISGLVLNPNTQARPEQTPQALMKVADQVRASLAGSLRSYAMTTFTGERRTLQDIPYGDQPTGYTQAPSEVVNYVENHDNMTLWDSLAFKLPRSTSAAERARVQVLGSALVAFSQGVAYFHAGQDILRSKSLDGNSYDSGDWFNRLDWTYQHNHFGTGLPPAQDNGHLWPLMRELLADPALQPTPADIAFARDAVRDLLKIRASSTLLRLPTAQDIEQRLRFFNVGPTQNPAVIAVHLDGKALNGHVLQGANFDAMVLLINVDTRAHTVADSAQRGQALSLHPVHLHAQAADRRPAVAARFDPATGQFEVPARTAMAWVLPSASVAGAAKTHP
ncbi:alpha-1,6-glucosidase [Limnohabitans sp. 2KL-1]|nr:alpha-1,6-glucosidase [Limnohabitans sp. 2KL-1]